MDEIYGISLEKLAELSSKYSALSAQYDEAAARVAFEGWLQAGGTDPSNYWLAHKGWSARFRADATGELQARFAAQQVQATAALLAEARQPRAAIADEREERTPDVLFDQLSSESRAERWQAALHLAHAIDIGAAKGGQYREACVPVLLDILENHDEDSAAQAEDAARRLVDIGERTAEVRGSMNHCMLRAEDELASFEAALAPMQSLAAPEQLLLRMRIDSYRSLVASLKTYLADFRDSPVASFAPPAVALAAASRRPAPPGTGGGFGLFLGLAALVLVAGAAILLFALKKSPSDATLNAALTAPESAAVAPSAAPPSEAPAATAEATMDAPAQAPSSKPAHGKNKRKHNH